MQPCDRMILCHLISSSLLTSSTYMGDPWTMKTPLFSYLSACFIVFVSSTFVCPYIQKYPEGFGTSLETRILNHELFADEDHLIRAAPLALKKKKRPDIILHTAEDIRVVSGSWCPLTAKDTLKGNRSFRSRTVVLEGSTNFYLPLRGLLQKGCVRVSLEDRGRNIGKAS